MGHSSGARVPLTIGVLAAFIVLGLAVPASADSSLGRETTGMNISGVEAYMPDNNNEGVQDDMYQVAFVAGTNGTYVRHGLTECWGLCELGPAATAADNHRVGWITYNFGGVVKVYDVPNGPGLYHYWSVYWWYDGGLPQWVFAIDSIVQGQISDNGTTWGRGVVGFERPLEQNPESGGFCCVNLAFLKVTKAGGAWQYFAGNDSQQATGEFCGEWVNAQGKTWRVCCTFG